MPIDEYDFGPIYNALAIRKGILDRDECPQLFAIGTRDRHKIRSYALKCGSIFLDRNSCTAGAYKTRLSASESALQPDTKRRGFAIALRIHNQVWADIGCGSGGLLEYIGYRAKEVVGCDPLTHKTNETCYPIVSDINLLKTKYHDVVTAFHVIEHVPDPYLFLTRIKKKMKKGAQIIIETPNANDYMIKKCESYKAHALWSQHVLLYSRTLLKKVMKQAGFKDIQIKGIQRYPLANHLHWLSVGKPRGHLVLEEMLNDKLDKEYEKHLDARDYTDTLWATGTNE